MDRTVALKDCDFIDKKDVFKVGENNKKRILEIISKDAEFFATNQIIDYSLLVGVNNKSEHCNSFISQSMSQVEVGDNSPNTLNTQNNSMATFNQDVIFYQTTEGGLLSSDKQHIYFIGIIDIFTHFSVRKKIENLYRSVAQHPDTISCVPPMRYA